MVTLNRWEKCSGGDSKDPFLGVHLGVTTSGSSWAKFMMRCQSQKEGLSGPEWMGPILGRKMTHQAGSQKETKEN